MKTPGVEPGAFMAITHRKEQSQWYTPMTRLSKSALWYARHGWAVFPLRPRTKEPYGGLGVYAATTDLSQVSAWWRRWPDANIGLHCGGSGLLAVDHDAYKDTYAGHELLAPADQETVTSLTGSGGTHLLYRVDDGRQYSNRAAGMPAGVDIRGWGGYIVLPPSVHPNGNLYQWELGYGPHEIDPRNLPASLKQVLDQSGGQRRQVGTPNSADVAAARDIVLAVLDATGIATYPETEYDRGGRRWIFRSCPFCPLDDPHAPDRGAYIVIARDGHISAGCQHERCRRVLESARMGGWRWLLNREKLHV